MMRHAVQAQREADEALDHETPLQELFEDQLNCADMILLNKADLVAQDALDAIEQRSLPRGARRRVVHRASSNGGVETDIVLGLEASAENDMDVRKSHHEQAGHEDHDHDDFETFVVSLPADTAPQGRVCRCDFESHRRRTTSCG